MNFPSE
jgi:predicted FMN-binding regulatory protein PaiB